MYAFQSEKMKVKAWWIMHLIIFVLMTLGCLACSESPQCVPGRVLACPCPSTGQGIQRCAEDGSRFLACECGHLEPPIASLNDKQSHLNTGNQVQSRPRKVSRPDTVIDSLTASKLSQVSRTDTKEASVFSLVNQANSKSQDKKETGSVPVKKTLLNVSERSTVKKLNKTKIMALGAVIEDASAQQRERFSNENKTQKDEVMTASKLFRLNLRNQKDEWWFYSETLERCVLAKNVNGIDYEPLKLLSDGCYRLNGKEEMNVRCDDPPLGPHTYRFSEKERDCIAKRSLQIKQQMQHAKTKRSLKISALEPVIEGQQARSNKSSIQSKHSSNQSRAKDSRTWHCMCYEEVVKGEAKLSTACRPSSAMCKDLVNKVKVGSAILVKDSVSAYCQTRKGSAPWRAFRGKGSRRYFWQPSSQPGAWWSSEGCFLNSRISNRKSKRSKSSRVSSRQSTNEHSKKREEDIPDELFRPIGTKRSLIKYGEQGTASRAERCEESCRANLVSKRELKSLYGVTDVPPLLRWGKNFAERVKLVKTICMSNQGKSKRGREACLKKVISKCTKYCERSGD